MHPIDDGLVRRLIGGQFPQWAGLAVERWPSGGTVNAMYRLGDDMAGRLPLVQGGAEDVSMEQGWLPRLAPHLPTRIPEVLGAGEPAQGYPWPWSVYRWLAGEHPEAGVLSEPVLLAKDLAAFVAAMRSITLPGAPKAHRGGPVASLDAETRAAIKELRGIPQEDIDCDAAASVWEEALRAPGWDGRQCGCMPI
jgi:aminoglycoside phosphotransferase (APT) family kinase protein